MSDIFSENTLANWRGNNSFSREALLCGVTEPQYWTGGTEVKKKNHSHYRPGQAHRVSKGYQDSRHMKVVRLAALRTGE